jgi:hypothetical protein
LSTPKTIQALGIPQILKFVGCLKIIHAVHRMKWAWQFGNVALAMWSRQLGNVDMAIEQHALCKMAN